MKKLLIIAFLAMGIQGCGNKSGDSAGPQVEEATMKVVKAVCKKNGEVVLSDSSLYDPKKEKSPEKLYLKTDEPISVDECEFHHYDQK